MNGWDFVGGAGWVGRVREEVLSWWLGGGCGEVEEGEEGDGEEHGGIVVCDQ